MMEIPFIKWVDGEKVAMLAIQNRRGFRHIDFPYSAGDEVPPGVSEFMERHPDLFANQ